MYFIISELIYRVSFIWQFSSSVVHLHFLPHSLWCRWCISSLSAAVKHKLWVRWLHTILNKWLKVEEPVKQLSTFVRVLTYQMSELHWEAAVWVVLNVHNFSVVGQDEKLTTSKEKRRKKTWFSYQRLRASIYKMDLIQRRKCLWIVLDNKINHI